MIEQLKEMAGSSGLFVNPDLQKVGLMPLVMLLGISLAASLFISFLYLQFYSGRETGSQIHRAFPLLGIAITAIFICIQFSLPLSLGLLGALSIVRFRTPIKEPEEIGFLMLVIASSLATATFNIAFLGFFLAIAIVAILVAGLVFRLLRDQRRSGALIVSLGEKEYQESSAELQQAVEKRVRRARLESVTRSEEGVVVTYGFRSLAPESVPDLQKELAAVVGAGDFTLLFHRGEV